MDARIATCSAHQRQIVATYIFISHSHGSPEIYSSILPSITANKRKILSIKVKFDVLVNRKELICDVCPCQFVASNQILFV